MNDSQWLKYKAASHNCCKLPDRERTQVREIVKQMLHKTFGYEGLRGEEKHKSSETTKLVNWHIEKMVQI